MSAFLTEKQFYDVLTSTGLPARYSHFTNPQEVPFLVYRGNGQTTDKADNTISWKQNGYLIEYYFKDKSPSTEEAIESALIGAGIIYSKSEDTWLEDEGVYLIYYYV